MAEIGALRAALSANAAQFEQDMGRARRAVRDSATGMRSSMQRARQGFNDAMRAMKLMAVAAVGGAVALGNMVRKQLEAADQATKTAQSVGVAVETLTAWNHAADLSGVSQQALANSFKITAQRAADVARGTGEARHAYQALGIDVQNADKSLKASDQLMLEVADKFSKMEDGAGKTALAVQLFGRSGADLIPMLNRGREGIAEMTDEAARLGLVIDTETGQAAERFRDNLTRLRGVKTGFVNQITRSVLPTLEAYTDRMVKASQETDGMKRAGEAANTALKLLLSTGTLLKVAFDAVGSAIGGAAAAMWSLVRGQFREAWAIAGAASDDFMDKMRAAGVEVNAIWNETADGIARKSAGLGDKMAAPVAEAADKAGAATQRMGEAIDRQIESLRVQAATFGMTEKATTLYRLAAQGATEEQLALAAAILTTIETQKQQTEQQARAKQIFEATRTPAEQFRAQVEELNNLHRAGAINAETYWRAIEKAYDGIAERANEAKTEVGEMSEFQIQAFRSMQSAMAEFFFDPMDKGLDKMLLNFANTVRRMIAEWLAFQALTGLFGADFAKGGQLGGLFGGRRASGGRVGAGRMYEVNERGPELLSLGNRQFLMMGQQSGSVTPNEQHNYGGTSITVPVNVGDKLLAADLKRSVESAVVDALRRHT